MQAGCALRRRGGQHNPPGDRWPDQRDLLGDAAADGEPEQVHLAQLQGGDERDGFPRHLSHGARCRSRGAADARVVEGDDPPACCQGVNQRRIPAVEVAAEVLEQDQRQGAVGLATALAAGGVPHAVHVFARGPHSLGLARGTGQTELWTTLAETWIHEQV